MCDWDWTPRRWPPIKGTRLQMSDATEKSGSGSRGLDSPRRRWSEAQKATGRRRELPVGGIRSRWWRSATACTPVCCSDGGVGFASRRTRVQGLSRSLSRRPSRRARRRQGAWRSCWAATFAWSSMPRWAPGAGRYRRRCGGRIPSCAPPHPVRGIVGAAVKPRGVHERLRELQWMSVRPLPIRTHTPR